MKLAVRVLVSICWVLSLLIGYPGGVLRQDLTRCPARTKCGYPASSRAARPRDEGRRWFVARLSSETQKARKRGPSERAAEGTRTLDLLHGNWPSTPLCRYEMPANRLKTRTVLS